MAGIVYAWVNGLSPGDTLDFALGAGLAAIDSADTINPAMSPALVAKLVRSMYYEFERISVHHAGNLRRHP